MVCPRFARYYSPRIFAPKRGVIFFEEILTMNHEHEPSVLISLCHFLLFLSGLLVGIAIYNLVEVPNNQIWPLTIGGILSIGLPVSFGFIRKKTLSEAFKELAGSSSKLGQGGYKSNIVALWIWTSLVLFTICGAIYERI